MVKLAIQKGEQVQKITTVFGNNYERFIAKAQQMRFKQVKRNFLDMNQKGNKQLLIWFYAMNSLNLMLNEKSKWQSLPMNYNFRNKIKLMKEFSKRKTDCSWKHISCKLNDKRFYVFGDYFSVTDALTYVSFAKTGKYKEIRIMNKQKELLMKKISEKILTLMSEVVFGNKKYLSWLKSQEAKQRQAKEWKGYVVNNDLEIPLSNQFQDSNFLGEKKEEAQEKDHDPPPQEDEILTYEELEKLIGKL